MIRPIVIAVDGPAASGKGTLSRRLATQFGLRHLDTGLSYRAVARALLDAGRPLDDEAQAIECAQAIDFATLEPAVLAEHGVGEAASKISIFPAVRRILVDKQRAFSRDPSGAVLDGRDIGTVVCPDAEVKLYVTASPQVRAERRHREILRVGGQAEYETILIDIQRRDQRDMERAESPLRPAADACVLDTTKLSIEAAFLAAKAIINAALAKRS